MSSATEADLKTLADEVATLRADLSKITATLQDIVRHGAGDATSALHDSFGHLQDDVLRAKERIVREIEEQPLTAALTTFTIGMLLGMTCRHR